MNAANPSITMRKIPIKYIAKISILKVILLQAIACSIVEIPAHAADDKNSSVTLKIEDEPGFYTVKAGDTLLRIAMEFGLSWRDLLKLNNLDNPNELYVGQRLKTGTNSEENRPINSQSTVKNEEISAPEVRSRERKQSLNSQILELKVTNTLPDNLGEFQIDVQTMTDTASLQIDGIEQGGRQDGHYTIKRVARVGQTSSYEIVARDVYGNTAKRTITVSRTAVESQNSFAALNPALITRKPERDAVAIIIGIADYKNLPKAEFSNDDARVFYDYAMRALGIKPENIKLLIDNDAEQVEILRTFRNWLPSKVRPTTDVYVFYSGHGLPTADGQSIYLIPPRAAKDLIEDTAIPFSKINAALQSAKPKSVTMILDACYSGQSRSGETLVASARPVTLKTENKLFPENFIVMTASQNDQISSSNLDLKHGIFSYYLMKGMEGDADSNKDGKITLGEMQVYLVEHVGRHAGMMSRKQEPQLVGDANRVLVGR